MIAPMQRQPISSKSIRSVGYDAVQRILEIEFVRGAVYQYREVPASVYEWLLRAKSRSTFFDRLIRDKYVFKRIDIAVEISREEDLLKLLESSVHENDGPDTEAD
ncbi:MAG: KTSC domain-containing protein [Gammaproteobacteria bacterium]